MSSSRRLAGDRLQAKDVVLYCQPDEEPAPVQESDAARAACRDLELESLDLLELGPYLLLLGVRERVEALVDEARAESESLCRQSRSQGVAEGHEEAKQEILPSAVAFANAGQALIVFEEQMIARYTPKLARLALEIAEKIVERKVAAEPDIVASVLERAHREVDEARRIRIHLNPADRRLLAEIRPDLLTSGSDNRRLIEVVDDETLSRGGCRLETEIGVIDATVPTQIAEIRRQLLDEETSTSGASAKAEAADDTTVHRKL